LKKRTSGLSRRRFLTIGSLGAVGVWAGYSQQMGARMVRGLVAETGRRVLKPAFTPSPRGWDPQEITAAWLGHSSVLVNFYGLTILTDPVLGRRVGAETFLGNIGAKRLVAPALRPNQLPRIDLVLLSHAHMDHLDPITLRALPGKPSAVTAHATRDLIDHCRFRKVDELRWGEKARIRSESGDVEVSAFEVKHWGARWKVDQYRGYNGYVIEREGKKIIFGGDTAMTSSFKSLKSHREFEFAIMPIGAYQPWICSHCTPEQAVQMANDADAKYLLPVHFKTFAFGREGSTEPIERLDSAMANDRIGWRDVGQTFKLG
jgi:L-ascorbate metabolism protein UlaG (beta-lactamase superfamily)